MLRMKTLYSAILIAFFLASCASKTHNPSKIEHVDSLMAELDTMNMELKKLEIETVVRIKDTLEERMSGAQNIQRLKRMRTMDNHIRIILQRYDHIHREVIYARNHLEDTKKDIRSGELKDSTINKMLEKENNIVADLENRIKEQTKQLHERIESIKKQAPYYE